MLSFYSNEGITWKYTTALAPWQGGFYECLMGLVKQGLRIEKRNWSQVAFMGQIDNYDK